MEIRSNNYAALGAQLKGQEKPTDKQEENGQVGASEEAAKAGGASQASQVGAVAEAGQTDTFSQCPGSIREMQEANAHNNVDKVAQFQQANA